MRNIVDLSEKKYLVTGASSGIGRATAILISQLGGTVVCIGRNEETLAKTLSQLEPAEGHRYFVYDLINIEGITQLLTDVVSFDNRKLNGLVHCAGISTTWPLRTISYGKMDDVMRINFYSFIELVKGFSGKKISEGGNIVGISSVASVTGGEKGQTLYAASKAAMEAAVYCLAQELSSKGIRINTIRPSLINTPMTDNFKNDNVSDDAFLKSLSKQLLGIGEPEDIAKMAVFLLSDASKFITGRSYFVDGGRLQ